MIGDRRNYLVALLTLDPTRAAARPQRPAGRRHGREALACPGFPPTSRSRSKRSTRPARHETIKVRRPPRELTIEGGELTPTLKLKRRVILERYRETIEALYTS